MTEFPEFVDFYEILEISPNANSGTIERMFRHFAQRYHPDNPETGDRLRFDTILEAHNTLKDPVARAQYDIRYKEHQGYRFRLAQDAGLVRGMDRDTEVQHKLLSILYVKRRRNVRDSGIGEVELEVMLDCPIEHLEFHLWYLKEKGLITKLENGRFAITVPGIDHANAERQRVGADRLMIEQRRSA